MSLFLEYMEEIASRKKDLGLAPKPIDSAELLAELIEQFFHL
jgi:aconitate hydratase 2/2-methylisocitrate dehydratase